MKKFLLVLFLAAGLGLIAFASLRSNNSSKVKKENIEKKADQPEKKKTHKKSCWFS